MPAFEGIVEQGFEVFLPEVAQPDGFDELVVGRVRRGGIGFIHLQPFRIGVFEANHVRMVHVDFVVAVGSDDEQVADPGFGEDGFEKVEGSSIRPLDIIQEDDQRMFGRADHLNELAQGVVEAVLVFVGREVFHQRLLPHDFFEGRNQSGDYPGGFAHGFGNPFFPLLDDGLVFGEQDVGEFVEGLDPGEVRRIALDEIELPGDEEAVLEGDGDIEAVDEARFPNTGIAAHGNEHFLSAGNLIEHFEQGFHFGFPSVEFLGNLEMQGPVGAGQGERSDAAVGFQQALAFGKVVRQSVGRLVAVFGILAEQFLHNLVDRFGQFRVQVPEAVGLSRKVTVDDFEGIFAGKGKGAGEEFEHDHAQRVEVGAVIDGAVHAPGLFGRHIRQGSFQSLCGFHKEGALIEAGRKVEINQKNLFVCRADEHIGRAEVFVDEVFAVHPPQFRGDMAADAQFGAEGGLQAAAPFAQGDAFKIMPHEILRAVGQQVFTDMPGIHELPGDFEFVAQ